VIAFAKFKLIAKLLDNPPTFEQPVYRLKILENEPVGYELMKVQAIDKDKSSQIAYSIKPDSENKEYFEILPNGVLRLTKSVDYEALHSLKVTVMAQDNGTPPLRSTCEIEVEILDVNGEEKMCEILGNVRFFKIIAQGLKKHYMK
jgi:hypothetical protein